eukprot:3450171-Amphidinium_carterae.1
MSITQKVTPAGAMSATMAWGQPPPMPGATRSNQRNNKRGPSLQRHIPTADASATPNTNMDSMRKYHQEVQAQRDAFMQANQGATLKGPVLTPRTLKLCDFSTFGNICA